MRQLPTILRALITALLLPIFTLSLHAQKVTDVRFEQVGDQVRITYRLDAPTDIQVFLSTNGGISYGYPLKAVQGDVGYNVAAGYKTILWSPLQETDQIVGDNIVFKVVPAMRNTTYNNTTEPVTPANPAVEKYSGGKLPGKFSVAPNREVQFAQGNLQYQASTRTWRFAEHQWDVVGMGYGQTNSGNHCYIGGTVAGSDNSLISSTYGGWIDLFGWGTGDNPTNKNSTSNSDYSSFTDWGNNPISNGGNRANQWRTLTQNEWVYLFKKRQDAKNKYGAAKVNGVTGVVLLPDYWTLPSGCGFTAGMTNASQWYDWSKVASSNIYSASQWQQMESAGAVFLPCAGSRNGASVSDVGSNGHYWSSTHFILADCLYFSSDVLTPDTSNARVYGGPVRLVSGL